MVQPLGGGALYLFLFFWNFPPTSGISDSGVWIKLSSHWSVFFTLCFFSPPFYFPSFHFRLPLAHVLISCLTFPNSLFFLFSLGLDELWLFNYSRNIHYSSVLHMKLHKQYINSLCLSMLFFACFGTFK